MTTATARDPILSVRDLHVTARRRDGEVEIVRGVSFDLAPGRMHAIVGETGSGKSMTARAILGLLPDGVHVRSGSVRLDGRELVGCPEPVLRRLRGPEIGMVAQNPRTALNPMLTVGKQMAIVAQTHLDLDASERRERIRGLLELVAIRDPERIARAYPHELSGGMAQRVVIATTLICDPRVLIADEPTTGLDATVQRQILALLADLQQRLSLSVLMITHDLGIVAQYCETVSIMYAGAVVESGTNRDLLLRPQADYTRQLVDASRLDLTPAAGGAA